ncbi:hypothetical protein E2C01_073843 [Portunus trituberculatus]|uniref:Uncharacterized protein n=1 Tax=Portunus trituberculatus TaxID=210409 RepID=A0A5B7I1T6_PORTR|nr:hypothetical protein [Portunus trituberculatus]
MAVLIRHRQAPRTSPCRRFGTLTPEFFSVVDPHKDSNGIVMVGQVLTSVSLLMMQAYVN